MIDRTCFENVLADYKRDFPERFKPASGGGKGEKFKWEAVKCFQDNWDANASDFAEMLSRSLGKTDNLLVSSNYFPRSTLERFAKVAPDEVRGMFIDLYDESMEVYERIKAFADHSTLLLQKYGNGAGSHYQWENAITTYLWLRYPDKYGIYKYTEMDKASANLKTDYNFKKGANEDNIRKFLNLSEEIRAALKEDRELVELLNSLLTDSCYPDPELQTLTIDFIYYTSKYPNPVPVPIPVPVPVPTPDPIPDPKKYSREDFLGEVYMEEERYNKLAAVLKNKKNIILQGAPGVGKTFAARRLAWSLMGEKDDSRIEFVQFHQNYSYEDFVMGYKPEEEKFRLKEGIFYRFCKKAEKEQDKEFFFIIDEINRGNLSKIFGELLMLIEKDYRGVETTLAYSAAPFSVPKNLYIIGMMNTADRSLAMIDYALRRRFSFFDMKPEFDSKGFEDYQKSLGDETFDKIISEVKELNHEIENDKSLGRGFCIGHSYFCGRESCDREWLSGVVEYDILPMLGEYWFDEPARVSKWEKRLREVLK